MARSCAHEGGHSAVGRYIAGAGRLRFLLVCDACGAERGDVDTVAYRPRPRPFANHPAERIARELGLEPRRAERVRLAALLCDIGAARIPTGVLDKRGPLTADEWEAVRRHPEDSAAMLGGPGYDDLRPWIVAHHERPDGRGYPFGLPAREIPIEAADPSPAVRVGLTQSNEPRRANRCQSTCGRPRTAARA